MSYHVSTPTYCRNSIIQLIYFVTPITLKNWDSLRWYRNCYVQLIGIIPDREQHYTVCSKSYIVYMSNNIIADACCWCLQLMSKVNASWLELWISGINQTHDLVWQVQLKRFRCILYFFKISDRSGSIFVLLKINHFGFRFHLY